MKKIKILFLLFCAVLSTSAVIGQEIIAKSKCAGEEVEFEIKLNPNNTAKKYLVTIDYADSEGSSSVETLAQNQLEAKHTYKGGSVYPVSATITYEGGFPADVVSTSLEIYKRPSVNYRFREEVAACSGETVKLEVGLYNATDKVLWSTGAQTSSINVTESNLSEVMDANGKPTGERGLYKAVVYNTNFCTANPVKGSKQDRGVTSVKFYKNPEINVKNAPEDLVYDKVGDREGKGLKIDLSNVGDMYNGNINYSWRDERGAIAPRQEGSSFYVFPNPEGNKTEVTYYIEAEQTHNYSDGSNRTFSCKAKKEIIVKVKVITGNESSDFTANNIFMPGSDLNSHWRLVEPKQTEWYKDCKLIIYNTYGQEVYVKEKIGLDTNLWDGRDNDGNELPADAYFYIVKCENCNCEPSPQENIHTGSVTIVRK